MTDPVTGDDAVRTAELRNTLSELKARLQRDLHDRMRDGRTDRSNEVVDQAEGSDTDVNVALELALIEMRATTLIGIDDAIARLDAGRYGLCFECSGPIAVRRLRALPFAVRCHSCEQERETTVSGPAVVRAVAPRETRPSKTRSEST